jgi:hypothetical protein
MAASPRNQPAVHRVGGDARDRECEREVSQKSAESSPASIARIMSNRLSTISIIVTTQCPPPAMRVAAPRARPGGSDR